MKKPLDRFLEKVKKTDTCWIFFSIIRTNGYGLFWLNGKNWNAHRASYLLHKGEIPIGAWVLHTCDNRACVNPDHLYLGDIFQNAKDMVDRGRIATGLRHGTKTCPKDTTFEKRHNNKIPKETAFLIRDRLINNENVFYLAKEYNVHFSTIYRARDKVNALITSLNTPAK